MVRIVGKVLWFVETVLIFIIVMTILILVYNFYQLKVVKRDYVPFFDYAIFEVVSNSMSPEINKDDVVIVKISSKINKGDVITYKMQDAFVTHRVLEINKNHYLTKGDANNTNDAPVNNENVVGKVVRTIPSLGTWRKVVVDPVFLISVIGFLALMNYIVFKNKGAIVSVRKKYTNDFKISHKNIIEETNVKK